MKGSSSIWPDLSCSAQYSGQIMQVAFEPDTTSRALFGTRKALGESYIT